MSVEREMSLAEWCAKLPNQHRVNQELAVLNKQLAALAEQNEKYREALRLARFDSLNMTLTDWDVLKQAANLPDLATPALNRIKAEAYREAADIVENIDVYTFVHGGRSYDDGRITLSSAATAILAKADELEKGEPT